MTGRCWYPAAETAPPASGRSSKLVDHNTHRARKGIWGHALLLLLLLLEGRLVNAAPPDEEVAARLAVIARTGPQGAGSAEARKARDELARHGVEILPQLLAAMDTPNPIAANWCRTIYEEVVRRGLADKTTVWPRRFLKE